jgi:hypothetical protein
VASGGSQGRYFARSTENGKESPAAT